MTGVAILVPAAGASRRMRGRDKLMEEVGGAPLLVRQVRMALATGRPVLATLAPAFPQRAAALEAIACARLTTAVLHDAGEGIAASLRRGAAWAAARQAGGLMVLLADLPELEIADLMALIDAFESAPERIWRATDATGAAGHPVLFPARLFAAMRALTGDGGGRALLRGEDVATLPLPGRRALCDLDTPEDWAAWRQGRG